MIHRYYAGKVGLREFKMNHQSNCLKLGHAMRIVSVVRGKLFQREIQSNRSTEKKNPKEIQYVRGIYCLNDRCNVMLWNTER